MKLKAKNIRVKTENAESEAERELKTEMQSLRPKT